MTPRRTTLAILASTLAALVVIAAGSALAQEVDKLNKIADALQKDVGAAKKLAAAYNKAHPENDELMAAFARNGLKVGNKSIDAEIRELTKKELSAADLKARSAELVRMTEHVTAVGFVSEVHGIRVPVKKGMPYSKLALDLVAAAEGLQKAVKAQNPAAVQKSANLVSQACTVCHTIYKE